MQGSRGHDEVRGGRYRISCEWGLLAFRLDIRHDIMDSDDGGQTSELHVLRIDVMSEG